MAKSNALTDPIDERLMSLRHCIRHGFDEDAQNHLFALLRGLRVKYTPDEQLTPEGRSLKKEWVINE